MSQIPGQASRIRIVVEQHDRLGSRFDETARNEVGWNTREPNLVPEKWLKSTSFVDRFFPADRSRPCYGFYSPAIDRLILVDSKDLFLSLQVATLFSSKVLLLVIVYDPTNHPV